MWVFFFFSFLWNKYPVLGHEIDIYLTFKKLTRVVPFYNPRILVVSHPYQHFELSVLAFFLPSLASVSWNLTVFTFITLMTIDVEYFVICLLNICISFMQCPGVLLSFLMSVLFFVFVSVRIDNSATIYWRDFPFPGILIENNWAIIYMWVFFYLIPLICVSMIDFCIPNIQFRA